MHPMDIADSTLDLFVGSTVGVPALPTWMLATCIRTGLGVGC